MTEPTYSPAVKRTVNVVAALSSFLAPFMSSSINIALPSIGQELTLNPIAAGWVVSAYLLAAATFLVPLGKIADIAGRKRVFIYGTALYTAASLLCALAGSALTLILARVLQGIGSAMIFGTGVAMLTSVFPPGERGRALGINIAATYTGLSVGPFLGGFLTQNMGWRSIFMLNLPLGLVILVLVLWQLRTEWSGAAGERFDWIGSLIYAVSLVGIMIGLSRLPDLDGLWLVVGGAAGVVAFAWWEARAAHPILNIDLFRRSRTFAFSNLAALIHYCATSAVSFLLSYYLQYVNGFSPQTAGLVLVAQPLMMVAFSPLAGRLSDHIAPRTLASTGMGITSLGLLLLAFLGQETPVALIVAYLMVLGFGYALFSSPNVNAIMSAVDRRFYGVASATLSAMRLLGQMLSMGIALLVLTLYVSDAQITVDVQPAFFASMRTAFIIFAALCACGVVASLARNSKSEATTRHKVSRNRQQPGIGDAER